MPPSPVDVIAFVAELPLRDTRSHDDEAGTPNHRSLLVDPLASF